MLIGRMRILHIASGGAEGTSGNFEKRSGVSYNKSDKIGTVYPSQITSRCGYSTGAHLHIKFLDNNMVVDGTTMTYGSTLPSSFTSKNERPPVVRPQIVDNSMSRVQPPLNAWYKALDSNCNINSKVVMWDRNDGDCQKMKYDSGNNSIRNPFGQCLDAGDGTKKLVFYTCNSSTNQRWFHEPGDGRIWSQQPENGTNKMRCIEYSALNNGDEIYVLPCSSDSRQKWYNYDLGIQLAWVPQQQPTVFNNYNGVIWYSSKWDIAFDVTGANPENGTPVKLWNRNGTVAQRWSFDSNSRQIKGLNNKCLDAGDVNNGSNRWLRINDCHSGSNQKWFRDTVGRLHTEAKTSLCVDSPSNDMTGSQLYLYPCHNWDNQKFYTDNMGINTIETFQKLSLNTDSNYGFDILNGNNSNQTEIKTHWYWNDNRQKFEYNSSTQEIRNKNGKCVDAGDINNPSNRWIRINDCHNGNNQKWYADGWGRIHSVANGNLCVDSWWWGTNGSPIHMGDCSSSGGQAWTWNYLT
jgi:Ricin-type beta-trefoil lectin domain